MTAPARALLKTVSLPDIEAVRPLTRFHERLLAEELTRRGGDGASRAARALSSARVDLNPHQVEAAAFALDALSRGGCMLADEVGLGKTIEAGIVLAQLAAEGRTRILVLSPATLRAQWQAELKEKFDLDAVVVDGRTAKAAGNPFDQGGPVIASINFAALRAEALSQVGWDVVVLDEAHRLRNAHRTGNKTGRALRAALKGVPKLLLTATPLQNDLSELFGLLSLLDEQILGPEDAFRAHYPVDGQGALPDGAVDDLKRRLDPVVHRTLRRQVREYVRFTNRRSVVEDFTPSPEEQALYEDVSEYLRRSEALALDPGRKTLLTLVYRKLLASSTFAIAPTLARLAEGVEKKLQAAKAAQAAADLLSGDDLKGFNEEAEEWEDDGAKEPSLKALKSELFELRQYADRAAKIRVNAKGEALRRALDRVFTVAKANQWPQKAVVFTESRRTQDYLYGLLEASGWKGQVLKLSGDAGTPEERAALVADFRDRASILLSTEAGAEGLNLQFCNLLVNYDLPWNPQRLEQRIGRCHRYGQARDVLVLNFLNRSNAADARLYELLEKKLNLFDGVFGASDEVLGALESGVDFERRVLDIYQSCRTTAEIDAAFDALRKDLEGRIDQRLTEARALLLEHFDGDVRKRLKVAEDQAREKVRAQARDARALTGAVLGQGRTSRRALQEAATKVRGRAADGVAAVAVDAGTLPPKLAGLAGKEGWWFAWRFELSGIVPEDRLVHLVLVRDGDGFKALPAGDGAELLKAYAKDEPTRRPPAVSVTASHDAALAAAKDELVRQAERRNALELDAAKERADRYAEDCLWPLRTDVDTLRAAWEKARGAVAGVEDPTERMRARAAAERAEREYRKKLALLRQTEEQRYQEKDRALAQLAQRAKVTPGRALVATAYFWAE